ncbi:MAG: TolC family protein [Henriciella sp.]|nr:TolC family protein [Henriciella sp.]
MLRTSLLLSTALLFGACATVEPGREEAREIASEQVPDQPDAWKAAAVRVGDVEAGWIEAFDDKKLSALVDEAQANNRNLRSAAINVERAWLLADQSGAALSPQVNATLGSSGEGNFEGQNSDSLSVGVQASWELDIWGRLRSGQQSAIESAEAADADYRFAQYSIAAGVARAYFGTINAEQQRQIAKDIVDALIETDRIVKVQFDNGFASAQDVALAKANLASSNDTLERATAARDSAIRSLEVLIGRYPATDLFVGSELPAKPSDPPAGLPSELLERRPDLIAAERQIAAAIDSVDQAKAARLPSISLTGGVSGASSDLSNLLNPANLAWQAASSLLVPVLDGDARETQVELSTVDQRAAVEAYAYAALTAFSEVESALADGQTLQRRKGFLEQASEASDEALRLAQLQYDVGEIDLLSVLQLQQAAFGARSNLLTLQLLELDQYIDLNLALGGDWQVG